MVPNGWRTFHLGDVVQILVSNVDKNVQASEVSIRLCNYTHAYYNRVLDRRINFSIGSAKFEEIEKYRLMEGDVIITKDSESPEDIAVPSYVAEDLNDVICGYHLAILRPKPTKVVGSYLAQLLQSQGSRYYFFTLANGVTRFGLTKSALQGATVCLPPVEEQTKIANILQEFDKGIELAGCVLSLTKYQKHVLRSKLIPEISENQSASSRTAKQIPLRNLLKLESRAVAKPSEPYTALGLRSHCKGTFLRRGVDPSGVMMDVLYEVNENDIILNITFAWEGAIAVATKNDQGALVSHRFPTYVINSPLIVLPFLRHVLHTEWFVRKLGIISPGGAGRNRVLNKNDFLRLQIPVPEIGQQTKIAALLVGLEEKETLLQQYIASLRLLKRGLMQSLLTGTVRVKNRPTEVQNA